MFTLQGVVTTATLSRQTFEPIVCRSSLQNVHSPLEAPDEWLAKCDPLRFPKSVAPPCHAAGHSTAARPTVAVWFVSAQHEGSVLPVYLPSIENNTLALFSAKPNRKGGRRRPAKACVLTPAALLALHPWPCSTQAPTAKRIVQ